MPAPQAADRSTPLTPWLVLGALVAIGVAGRWGQPDWNVTPLAAVALMAGYAMPRLGWAIATPLMVVFVSNLLLDPYQNGWVAASVYGSFALAAMLGRALRRPVGSTLVGAARLATVSVAPAMLFYLVTNFAVWASQSMYPKTAAGLAECYAAAAPFYRQMLAGDLAYTTTLFGAAAIAGAYSLRGLPTDATQQPASV